VHSALETGDLEAWDKLEELCATFPDFVAPEENNEGFERRGIYEQTGLFSEDGHEASRVTTSKENTVETSAAHTVPAEDGNLRVASPERKETKMAAATDKTIDEKLGTPDRKPEAKQKSVTPTAKRSRRLPSSFQQSDGAPVTPIKAGADKAATPKPTPKSKGKKKKKNAGPEATGNAPLKAQLVVKEKVLGCFWVSLGK
jgi:hypothetical protein